MGTKPGAESKPCTPWLPNLWHCLGGGKHKILRDIELIPIQAFNQTWERLLKQIVESRFLIDTASLKYPTEC